MKIRRIISLCLVLAMLATTWAASPMTVYAAQSYDHAEHLHQDDVYLPALLPDAVPRKELQSPVNRLPEPLPEPEEPALPQTNDTNLPQEGVVASGTCGENLSWTLDDGGTLTIFGTGEMENYDYSNSAPWQQYSTSIKTAIIKEGVINIGSHAFYQLDNLTHVTIENNVKIIGSCAFLLCSNLTTVTIPDSINRIDSDAFGSCYQLQFNIHENVKYLGNPQNPYVFLVGSSSNIVSYVIPDGAKVINAFAFSNCRSLAAITIPDGVTYIGDAAFQSCGISEIVIPDSVAYIGEQAFFACDNLMYSEYDNAKYLGNSENPYFVLVQATDSSISSCAVHENTKLIAGQAFYECTSLASVTIPVGITFIGSGAFCYCSSLQSIAIPNSVIYLGSQAFSNCSALKSVEIPGSITHIGSSAFSNCASLTDVILEDGVKIIEGDAFYNCRCLTSITIPKTITHIDENAFYNAYALKSVYISDIAAWCGITFADEDANPLRYGAQLYDNGELITDLLIPNTVTGISDYAFYNCSSLTNVTIPDTVTSLGSYAFCQCSNLGEVTIGNGITCISSYAFRNCSNLSKITLGSNVTRIDNLAFYYCTQLSEIMIPNSVTSIGQSAFGKCTALAAITIPDSVTTIESSAFSNCSSLASVVIGDGITILTNWLFENCSKLISISIGSSVNTIEREAFKNCTKLENVYITDITAWCNMQLYNSESNPMAYAENLYIDGTLVTDLVIPENVTQIAPYAFYGCESLVSITMRDSITSIGEEAFYRCSNLTSVTIGDSDVSIGDSAFYECTELATIVIGNGRCSIASYAFRDCTKLTRVEIGEGIISLNASAFSYCTNLVYNEYDNAKYLGNSLNPYVVLVAAKSSDITSCAIHQDTKLIADSAFSSCYTLSSMVIPEGVANIGKSAFNGCNSLTNINIPETVISIGDSAFSECSGLTKISIPDSVVWIGTSAFRSCSNLMEVTLGDGLTSIGNSAFEYCSMLKNITFGSCSPSIGQNAFYRYSNLTNVYLTDIAAWCATEFYTGDSNPLSVAKNVYWNGTLLTELVIPEGVTSINKYAFYKCAGLITVTIPDSMTSIGDYAFYQCVNLKAATIGNGVMGERVFYSCENLNSVTVNNGAIGDRAFFGCHSLTDVTIGSGVTQSGFEAFYSVQIKNVYISDLSAWCSIAFDGREANPLCYADNLYLNGELITELVISQGITAIGQYAFCEFSGLTGVVIADSVTSIGDYAFYLCGKLASITLGNGVRNIGKHAFQAACVTDIAIPDSMISIGDYAFCNIEELTSVAIPDSVTSLGAYAFSGCENLASVTIGNGITNIGNGTFQSCYALNNIFIPDNVTSIGAWAFQNCYGLVVFDTGNGVTTIGEQAFYYCPDLTAVIIGKNVTRIEDDAFDRCEMLWHILYKGTEQEWNAISFFGFNAIPNCTRHYNCTGDEIIDPVNWICALCCDHVYGDPVTVPATCTENGYTGYVCTICGYVIKEATIFATGHAFGEWIVDQEPTCDVPGSRHRICSVCGETETEELIAQHQYGPWIMTGYWTCTEPGSRYHICYLCGYREDDIIPPTGHEYEAVVTPPTCTEQGYTTYTCHCGDYYVADYVLATGHIFIGRDCLNCDAVDENFENPTCGIDPSILYDRMMALQEYFPEGMPWTNDDFYESGSYGCAAFAFLLSDAAFGTLPSEVITENITIDQIRVGDVLQLYDDTHSVIVLEVYANYIVIAEGNYNSSIHWGRVLTADEIRADADYIMTRYPSHVYTEEIFEPTCTTQGYTMHTCSACGDQYADSYIDALGHDYEGGVCKNCGDTAWPITGTCGDSLTWSLSEDGTLTISGTGDMWDYAWNNAPWINYCTSITALVIEDGVTSIGIYAFHSFSALSSVTIGNDVANIGNMAFWNCTGLTSIALPNSVVYIGDKAFQSCIKLASVTLGSSLTAIGDYAFASCSSLTQITFPASVKEIGAYAFDRCNSLVKIAFAGEAPDIGNDAFTGVIATVLYPMCNQTWTAEVRLNYGGSLTWETYNNGHQYGDWLTDAEPTCTEPGSKHRTCSYCGVTETVEMPATGHNYVSGVCQNCGDIIWPISGTCGDNLTWTLTEDGLLTISGTGAMDDFAWSSAPWRQFSESIKQVVIEDGVTSIGNHAFFECSSLTNITIPSGVTSIGSHAFYNCSGMKSITIPSGVTSIGDHAFWNCMSLKNITIPSGIRKIEPYTFWGCSSLTSITIPDGVVSIGNCAFEICYNLISITIPASVKTIDFWAFRGCDHLWHVLYKGTEQQWNAIAIDEANEELLAATRHYNCTGDEITNPKKKICTLCCDHADFEWIIDQNPSCTAPGSKHRTCSTCGKIETAEIPATGHHYEDGVCQNCGENNWLASGQCGDNLTWVLTEDGILTVSGTGDMWEFGPTGAPWRGYGNSIVTVIIEEGVTGIGSLAFDRCYALTDITMPDSLTYINHFAFQYCYNLTSVVIGSGVTSIGNYAFSECTGLASITIPHGMTDIGAYAFSECFGLVSIVIPESVKSIHLGAFKDCTNLVSVTIPDSVTYIGGQVFQGCSKLWHVLYKGTEEQWSEVLIGEQNDTLTNAIRHYNCTGDEIVDLDNGICILCCQHSRGEEVDVQATCTEAGYTGYICNICGHTVKETIVPATGHSGTWFTDSSATCTQPGSKHRTCPLCGITETQQIPATGHSFTNYISDGNATTEKDGTKTARCDHGCGATHTVADAGSKLPPAKITSNVYTIKDGYISKIPVGLTAVEFLKGISGIGVRIQKNGTTVTESTKIGTGMVIQLVSNGKVVDSLIIVVTGDTNGDGNISVTDMIAVKAHVLKKTLLTGAAEKAADTNADKKVTITDFIQIKAQILGKSQIKPAAAEEKPAQTQAVPMTLDAPETEAAVAESIVVVSTMKPMYRISALVKQKESIV